MVFTASQVSPDGANQWLRQALGLPEEDVPFPWQQEILRRFLDGTIERSIDIPTGLGKTGVMAIWLVARAYGAALPRRLVYVVDRRAVVDQATDVANGLRVCVEKNPAFRFALGLEDRALPISTLRGQHVDNKQWLEDPASPAIIVGTVDMIGSRLLFEGYRTSRKMRPYHAGLLGADALVVLDEAHLVPPFEKLLESIADGRAIFGPRNEALQELVPPFRLLSLSATGRGGVAKSFGLGLADLEHDEVRKRLDAPKCLTVLRLPEGATHLEDALAEQAWKLAENGKRAVRCIVFCHERKIAAATKAAVERRAAGDKKVGVPRLDVETQLFVGGRRVFERQQTAEWLKQHGFLAASKVERFVPAFLFATSAGEVGVDLDADHMVSDLVTWERMVQRLGRVNRRGEGKANVIVIVEPQPTPSKAVDGARKKPQSERTQKESNAIATYEASIQRARALAKPLDRLPRKNGAADASPGALRTLRLSAETDRELQAVLDAATTPVPLRPALSRPLVDAWSMTSLKEHTGRPEIDPWLRGWIDDDQPQTVLVWRTHLPVRPKESASKKEIEAFFEAAPPHASEVLETETWRVVDWLAKRAERLLSRESDLVEVQVQKIEHAPLRRDDVVGIALTPAGDKPRMLRLADLDLDGVTDARDKNERKGSLTGHLTGATLVLDARVHGLRDGLLDDDWEELPRTADDGCAWIETAVADGSESRTAPLIPFRVRTVDGMRIGGGDLGWQECYRFAVALSEDGEPIRWLVVENAATEERRSVGRPQMVDEHQEWTEKRARGLAFALRLPEVYARMLAIVASLHDEGKRAKCWQRAFNAPKDGGDYAKTRGPVNVALLDGYRHELASLPVVAKDVRFRALPDDLQDLALHMIAAHHGFARPVISTSGCEDAPPSTLEDRASEIALRFARLQKRWGPWGLAWWESLLRAADQQASRDSDALESAATKASV